MLIKQNDVVLFQGDSITDTGRDRENPLDLGRGYVMIASAWFSALYPEMNVTFLDRGISGNLVSDLESRWQTDCLDLKPNVLSILIGVNDCIRNFAENNNVPVEKYKEGYKRLLSSACEANPDTKIILMEPFSLALKEEHILWRGDLVHKIAAMRDLADEFADVLIPLDGIFQAAKLQNGPAFWLRDGVHPTPTGHALMAQHWLKAVGAI